MLNINSVETASIDEIKMETAIKEMKISNAQREIVISVKIFEYKRKPSIKRHKIQEFYSCRNRHIFCWWSETVGSLRRRFFLQYSCSGWGKNNKISIYTWEIEVISKCTISN